MKSECIIGYDPGGKRAHGVAKLEVQDGTAVRLSTKVLNTAEEVLSFLESATPIAAIGVDTLTCWSTGPSGWRPADRWLREQYPDVQNSVVSPNSLFGSMGLNGMAVLIEARRRSPAVHITETHPKVLYWHFARAPYDYPGSRGAMDELLEQRLNVAVSTGTEHEWDAAISALAALESYTGRWTRDLHTIESNKSRETNERERLIQPCGKTLYSWPE